MTDYTLYPSSLSGAVTAPSSKSHTLRAILFASLARGVSTIEDYLQSPDTQSMIKACEQLGAHIKQSSQMLKVEGVAGEPQLAEDIINVGNSGQVLRFVGAISALIKGYTVFTGDHSIRHNRPLLPLMEGLRGLGAECISTKEDGYAPIVIKGPIQPGSTALSGEDSQPVSGLLMAAAFLKGPSLIKVRHPGEKPWIALTLHWFDKLGIKYINNHFHSYEMEGNASIKGFHYRVPGDFSSMAYVIGAALVTGSSITLDNVDREDVQGDKAVIFLLQAMGANIQWKGNTLHIRGGNVLKGMDMDVNDCIDALPILAVIACYAQGTTRLLNAAIARKKESDRLEAITKELTKMGAILKEGADFLIIEGSELKGAVVDSHSDHRIALSLAVAALGAKGSSTIKQVDCINKSYKGFYGAMEGLGARIRAHG